MQVIAVTLLSLIASTFLLDTAWANRKGSSYKSPKNVSVTVQTQQKVINVKSHNRSTKNNTTADNWSTIGNVNPYTGKKGTKRP